MGDSPSETAAKANCWEAMRCGREPGGRNVAGQGICPAAVDRRVDGVNGGKNGGRACWAVSGTFCEGKIQGSFAIKMSDCLCCPFYKQVHTEEGDALIPPVSILMRLHNPVS